MSPLEAPQRFDIEVDKWWRWIWGLLAPLSLGVIVFIGRIDDQSQVDASVWSMGVGIAAAILFNLLCWHWFKQRHNRLEVTAEGLKVVMFAAALTYSYDQVVKVTFGAFTSDSRGREGVLLQRRRWRPFAPWTWRLFFRKDATYHLRFFVLDGPGLRAALAPYCDVEVVIPKPKPPLPKRNWKGDIIEK